MNNQSIGNIGFHTLKKQRQPRIILGLWIDVKIANAKDGALNGPQSAPDMLSSCGQIYGTAKAPRESFMIQPPPKKKKLFMTFLLIFTTKRIFKNLSFSTTKQSRCVRWFCWEILSKISARNEKMRGWNWESEWNI